MQFIYFDSPDWETAREKGMDQAVIKDTVESAVKEGEALLPPLSPYLNIAVRPDKEYSIPEVGEGGFTWDEEQVNFYFDPDLPYGVESLKKHLRATVLHELNHAARRVAIPFTSAPIEDLVAEGIATHFEVLHGNVEPLWAQFENDETMQLWLKEVLALPERNQEYLFNHSDGRRWIIYKTGTWVVGRVLAHNSMLTIQDLTTMPAQHVLDLLP